MVLLLERRRRRRRWWISGAGGWGIGGGEGGGEADSGGWMGRRDALERGETRRLYLSRTPLQAVRCSWQHPGMAKEGTPTQIHAHAGTYTHARAHIRTLRVILPSCGGIDYGASPPPLQQQLCGGSARAWKSAVWIIGQGITCTYRVAFHLVGENAEQTKGHRDGEVDQMSSECM